MAADLSLIKGERIALAFSGGRDSVALADVFLSAGIDFFAVHVEHGIRGESSIKDLEFARQFCLERGISIKVFHVDAPAHAKKEKITLEQAARKLRYEVLDSLKESGECDLVALAHHAGDQAETILMRIIRGTGIGGLRGMRPLSNGYVRPLLKCARADIDEYVKEKGLQFVEDESNSDLSYTRNFLRAELATMRDRFPSLDTSFARLALSAGEDDDFIGSFVPPIKVENGEARIDIAESLMPGPIFKRAVLNACAAVGATQDIEEKHLVLLKNFIESASEGQRLCFTHGVDMHFERGSIVFAKRQTLDNKLEVPFSLDNLAMLGLQVEKVSLEDMKIGDGSLYIDLDKIPSVAVLRYRREGDKIVKFGGGTKSFGDFLTDKKVPLRKRDLLVVCASGSYVLFAVGVDISDMVKVDEKTTEILRI